MEYRILLVEDEVNLMNTILLNLELEGYKVDTAVNGKKALERFEKAKPDLLILDVMLPEIDGYEVCKKIRGRDKKTPILFLTAKGASTDRVHGLKLGADDYLTKPFDLEEFLLRVKNLLKRNENKSDEAAPVYKFGENEINFITYEICGVSSKKQQLTKREVQLLKLLIENKNKVVSRDMILQHIWGEDIYPTARTIDNYILAFRKYFEPSPREPRYFHSIRGVGYKFTEQEAID
jgi:two-component system, OmpR family, alkaline phosphatase synthesis response regulator PhoP